METFNPWRLDTPLKRNSKFKWLMISCWLAMLLLMVLIFRLVWWQAAMVIISSFLSIILTSCWHHPVIHLTQPNIDNKDKLWQIYIGHKNQNQFLSTFLRFTKNRYDSHQQVNDRIMWQGDLSYAKDFGYWVLLRFQIVEPFAKPLTLVVFKDQIELMLSTDINYDKNHDSWRLLKTIARLNK